MYEHEKPTDTACVMRRTEFIITFADCPVLWVSKLQNETTLLNIEAEILPMAHCYGKLFLIIGITT